MRILKSSSLTETAGPPERGGLGDPPQEDDNSDTTRTTASVAIRCDHRRMVRESESQAESLRTARSPTSVVGRTITTLSSDIARQHPRRRTKTRRRWNKGSIRLERWRVVRRAGPWERKDWRRLCSHTTAAAGM